MHEFLMLFISRSMKEIGRCSSLVEIVARGPEFHACVLIKKDKKKKKKTEKFKNETGAKTFRIHFVVGIFCFYRQKMCF